MFSSASFSRQSFSAQSFALTGGAQPQPSEGSITIPYLIGKTQDTAEARIRALHCTPVVIGSGGTVLSQNPPAFYESPTVTTITVTMGGVINPSRKLVWRGLPRY